MEHLQAKLDALYRLLESERLKKQQAERQQHTHAQAEAVVLTKIAALEERIEREKGKEL